MKHKVHFILGSSSPRREDIFKSLGFDFEIQKPGYEEVPQPKMSPEQYVGFNADSKGKWLCDHLKFSEEQSSVLILSADTIVVLDERILEKPRDAAHSIEMLQQLSGREHTVMTAFSLFYRPDSAAEWTQTSKVEQTRVKFYKLSEKQIFEYIRTGEPADKAGSYGIQGMGSFLVEQIKGSLSNVMGLPKEVVQSEIEKLLS